MIHDPVRFIQWTANRVAKRMPGDPEPEELWADGWLGYAKARERFDPTLGHKFSTFAYPHVSGAMLEGQRRWRGRSEKGKRQALRHAPLREWLPSAERTDDQLLSEERIQVVRAALAQLPEDDRRLLTLLYYEGLSARDVAALYSVTESRISQRKRAALGLLRGYVRGLG